MIFDDCIINGIFTGLAFSAWASPFTSWWPASVSSSHHDNSPYLFGYLEGHTLFNYVEK